MNKPNILPGAPLFNIIKRQEASLRGLNWQIDLDVETEEPSVVIELTFLIPVSICSHSFTPFTLGRHIDRGWILIGKKTRNGDTIVDVSIAIEAIR